MGDVINLRLHRKRKVRTTRDAKASENRARFGRTKAEKERERAIAELEAKRLEEHRLPEDSDKTRLP